MTYARFILQTEGDTPAAAPRMLDTDKLTINELLHILRPEIEELDQDGHEYFSVSPDCEYNRDVPNRRYQPIGHARWIACYPVTGGSEGHYVHVDRIYSATPYAKSFTHEGIFLVKTFGGWERACEIATHLATRLGA